MTATAQQQIPFRGATRQRRVQVQQIAYNPGQTLSFLLPQIGMVSRLFVQVAGTITRSGSGTLTDQGPWNTINRMRVYTNTGSSLIADVSGYGGYLAGKHNQFGFLSDNAGFGATTPSADVYAYPLTTSTQTIALSWIVPISVNTGFNFEVGLLNLQSPETRVYCDIVCGALTDPDATITAQALTVTLWYEYYEITVGAALPILTAARMLQDSQPIAAVGDNIYTIPRFGTMLWLDHIITLNAARSDSYDSVRIRINKSDEIYRQQRTVMRIVERNFTGFTPKTGVAVQDWYHTLGLVGGMSDSRDAFDTEEVTTLESIVTISSGASLGSNNNLLESVRRVAQIFN